MKRNSLLFGPAGIGDLMIDIPSNSKNQTADAIPGISKLGLDCLEIEFVRNVYLKKSPEEKVNQIKQNAIDNNIELSIHAPYFVNLNAKEDYKLRNSQRYILDSLNVGHKIGAKNIVVHIGYFLKQERQDVLDKITNQIQIIKDNYKGDTKLGIELTGKKSQVGSLEDIYYFMDKFPNFVMPVIDFAHQHARENGYFKDKKNINSFFEELNTNSKVFDNMHIHMSGINYGEKGEKNHLPFSDSDMPYKTILEKLKDNKAKGRVICESPEIVSDALLLKNYYSKL